MTSSSASHPWDAAYAPGVKWTSAIPARPLFALFDESAQRFANNPCVDFLDRKYTYSEISDLIDRAAEGFRQLGVAKGVRVGICLPNTPFYVISFFAILKAGGTVVNINPLYAEREIAHLVADSGMRIIVTLDIKEIFVKVAAQLGKGALETIVGCRMRDALPTVKGFLFSLLKSGDVTKIPGTSGYVTFDSLIAGESISVAAEINPDSDIAVLQYTGGTTGIPKGAVLTHANLCANTEQLILWNTSVVHGEEKMLTVLPFFHVFAMTVILNFGVAIGAELILLPRFEVKQALKTIVSKKPTLFPAVPAIFATILADKETATFDLSSIKFCISGGAPLPFSTKHGFEKIAGCEIVEGYGLSETSPVATCNPIGGVSKESSIGIPLPQTIVEVRDPEQHDKKLAVGEKGEICISGPQVMSEYWNKPEETASTIRNGFLHTGDIGYMDNEGYFFLVDRQKDLILNGGMNVYPRMVEDAIYLHEGISEAIVIGIPHPTQGEVPKAFVTLHRGVSLEPEELVAFLTDKLSPTELPRQIEIRDTLPKTLIGKLSKKELVEEERLLREKADADTASS